MNYPTIIAQKLTRPLIGFIILIGLQEGALAQSGEKPCASNYYTYWSPCYGKITFTDYSKYEGELRYGKFNGSDLEIEFIF